MEKMNEYTPQKNGSVVAIKIYNKGCSPMAVLAFAFGGFVEIRWDVAEERNKYKDGINAYTLYFDARPASLKRTFASFIKKKKKAGGEQTR